MIACIDAILALVLIEAIGLLVFRRMTGRGPTARCLMLNLLAGGFLLLALRFGVGGAAPAAIVGCLALAGVAHLGDLRLRWGRS